MGPDDETVCKGMNVTFNCGYYFIDTPATLVSIPQWMMINGAVTSKDQIDNDPDDLLQVVMILTLQDC